jgi:hypothetical protein
MSILACWTATSAPQLSFGALGRTSGPLVLTAGLTRNQEGKVVADPRGVAMLGAPHLLEDRQRAFVEGPCLRKIALSPEHGGEVVEARLGAEHLLVDCQRALEERPRRCEVALALEQDGEVVDACRGFEMLCAAARSPCS